MPYPLFDAFMNFLDTLMLFSADTFLHIQSPLVIGFVVSLSRLNQTGCFELSSLLLSTIITSSSSLN
jgi:hypothetical protein